MYNPHNTCLTQYYVESKKYGMLLLETFFSTQGNMKKRGPGGNAKSSAAVGAGDARVVEVVDDTERQGRGDNEDSTNNSKKAKITSVRELGETSKPPTKITKKKQDQDDLARQFINILQNEDKTKEDDEIDMALGAIGIRIRRALNLEQEEDVIEEINMVVNRHIKNARASRLGIFSRAPTATVTQHQMPQQQQHQGQTLPPMPSLQNIQHKPFQYHEFEAMHEGMDSYTNL